MGRYAAVDWIQFEWDERRGGFGPVRSSMERARAQGWYQQLAHWLDPGQGAGVSLCRLVLNERVVVLSRTRTDDTDSRRNIRVQAYLGNQATRPEAMPNVRQTLALASGWAARLPDTDEPLDLGELIGSYEVAGAALDRESRAGAAALAPIVSECLRRPQVPLSVVSSGNPIVQLWGLVDIVDLVLGRYPETFSTYETDDVKPEAEIIFLRKWPGARSQGSQRVRVDPRDPGQDDRCYEIASMVVAAYAEDQLVGLVKRLRIDDRTTLEERLRLLGSVRYDSTTPVARPAPAVAADPPQHDPVWSPVSPRQPYGVDRSGPLTDRPAAEEPARGAQPSASRARPAAGRQAGRTPGRAEPPDAPGTTAPAAGGSAGEGGVGRAGSTGADGFAGAEASGVVEAEGQPGVTGQGGQRHGGQGPGVGAQGVTAQGGQRQGDQRQSVAAQGGQGQGGQGQGGQGQGGQGQVGGRAYAARDAFEMLRADLAQARGKKEITKILQEMRAWAATRQPSDVRSRLPLLIPDLEHKAAAQLLPEGQINPILRDLLDPDAHARSARPNWLDLRWLILVAGVALVLIFQIMELIIP